MKIKWQKVGKNDKIGHSKTLTTSLGINLIARHIKNGGPLTDTDLLFKMPRSNDKRKAHLEIINRISIRLDYLYDSFLSAEIWLQMKRVRLCRYKKRKEQMGKINHGDILIDYQPYLVAI